MLVFCSHLGSRLTSMLFALSSSAMRGAMSIVALLILAVVTVSAEPTSAATLADINDNVVQNKAFLELAAQTATIDPTTNFSSNVIKFQQTGDLAESLAFLFMLVAISICWIECCRGRKFF